MNEEKRKNRVRLPNVHCFDLWVVCVVYSVPSFCEGVLVSFLFGPLFIFLAPFLRPQNSKNVPFSLRKMSFGIELLPFAFCY